MRRRGRVRRMLWWACTATSLCLLIATTLLWASGRGDVHAVQIRASSWGRGPSLRLNMDSRLGHSWAMFMLDVGWWPGGSPRPVFTASREFVRTQERGENAARRRIKIYVSEGVIEGKLWRRGFEPRGFTVMGLIPLWLPPAV